MQNEKSRREGAEADSSRLAELQEENSRLLRNEEELLLLVLDMEAQIDRLVQGLSWSPAYLLWGDPRGLLFRVVVSGGECSYSVEKA